MLIKRFYSYEELEKFVNENNMIIHDIKRFDDSDVYSDSQHPNHNMLCNYVIVWILIYELKKENSDD